MIRSALVIGGGIAGPVAAMALQKAGIDAVIYEAYPSSAGAAGGSMTLAPHGRDALDVIGMGDLVRPRARPRPASSCRTEGQATRRVRQPARCAADAVLLPQRALPHAA
jgi:2-polyprenyl-6-methoxyphenol hydroxylase-like FAD-dependent oxidoreductase